MRTRDLGRVLMAALAACSLSVLPGGSMRAFAQDDTLQPCPVSAHGERYVDFRTFEALRALASELSQVGFAGLADAGYELWARGQMRVPAGGSFVRADLNRDGKAECAIILDGLQWNRPGSFILIASPAEWGWMRHLLQRLDSPGAMRWDVRKQAIEIDTGVRARMTSPATMRWEGGRVVAPIYGYAFDIRNRAYIRWDPTARRFEYASAAEAAYRPWHVRANLASYARDYRPEDFAGVHIMVTPLGPSAGFRQGLYVVPPHYAPNLDLFKAFRRPGRVYRSDGAGSFTAAVLPSREIQSIVLRVDRLRGLEAVLRRGGEIHFGFSVAIIDAYTDRGPNFSEVLLTVDEATSLLSKIAGDVGGPHPQAARVITRYVKAARAQ